MSFWEDAVFVQQGKIEGTYIYESGADNMQKIIEEWKQGKIKGELISIETKDLLLRTDRKPSKEHHYLWQKLIDKTNSDYIEKGMPDATDDKLVKRYGNTLFLG